MPYSEHKNRLTDLLYQPKYSIWRHLFIVVAIVATALSQSFFVFGKSTAIATSTIYIFGMGFAACTLAIIYINVHYLAPHFLSKKAYISYGIILLLIITGLTIAKSIAEYTVLSGIGIYKKPNGVTVLDGLSNTILYTICVTSTSITLLFRQLMTDKAAIESLENTQLKNSINEIKNRIHPQFLYATLANVSEKVKNNPQQASDTVFALSELLRYQLYDSTRNKVLLASDIAFVRNYLRLHQQNSGHPFSFELSVEGNTNRFVSPAIFTAFIEEMIAYQPQILRLTITVKDACIQVLCEVSGVINLETNDFSKTAQKLKLIYGNDAIIEKEADTLTIHFTVC